METDAEEFKSEFSPTCTGSLFSFSSFKGLRNTSILIWLRNLGNLSVLTPEYEKVERSLRAKWANEDHVPHPPTSLV